MPAKRVLRRLAKVMPELLNEYFKAGAAKPEEKLSNVIVTPKPPIGERRLFCVFCDKELGSAMVGSGFGTGERFAHPECYEASFGQVGWGKQVPSFITKP